FGSRLFCDAEVRVTYWIPQTVRDGSTREVQLDLPPTLGAPSADGTYRNTQVTAALGIGLAL
ncbi:MAG TPA: hypothetical protein VFH51_01225, partial [Myxococcota bacterium]|nr:hypothetical protein [Myxococcota bacterium]